MIKYFKDLYFILVYTLFSDYNKFRYKIKYCFFLFKWFLIGKNHCDLPAWSKKYFYILHKLLWIIICLSLVLNFYYLLSIFE